MHAGSGGFFRVIQHERFGARSDLTVIRAIRAGAGFSHARLVCARSAHSALADVVRARILCASVVRASSAIVRSACGFRARVVRPCVAFVRSACGVRAIAISASAIRVFCARVVRASVAFVGSACGVRACVGCPSGDFDGCCSAEGGVEAGVRRVARIQGTDAERARG